MKSFIHTLLIISVLSPVITYGQTINPSCVDASRECVKAAATAYLNALVSHDASAVPFAPHAHRWENGVNTGTNGDLIRKGLESDFKFKSVKAIRDMHWLIDGEHAIVFYLLDAVIPYTHFHYGTTRIAERFHVKNGLIEEIDAIFCTSIGKSPETHKIGQPTRLSIMCNRSLF